MNLKNKSPQTTHYSLQTLFLGKERGYFVENLSMLVSSGMPIISALDAIAQELRSRRMKNIIADIKTDIESGSPLWRALASSKIFPEHAISLIRLGEQSGKLTENLKVIAIEQEKDRVLKSKLRSAMMYPVFVLSLTVIIGVGIAWFILPKLATVFSQLKIKLPLITKILIGIGNFLGEHGRLVIPAAVIGIAVLFFFIFSFSKTKFIGQFILFSSPGIKGLIKEVEIARFGYLLGTILEAGLPITQALDSLASAAEVAQYRKLFIHLRDSVGDGNSIQKSFASFRHIGRLIPAPIQQLIVAGEQSGTLSGSLLKIGQTFEAKVDTTTKNLTIILEPILLVVVWLGVVAVALAVILPIYSLVGGFNAGLSNETETQSTSTVKQTIINPSPPIQEPFLDMQIIEIEATILKILPTGLGYLNVRNGPLLSSKIVSKVTPGDIFEYQDKQNNWYKIILSDKQTGWVLGKYIEEVINE